MTNIQIPIFDGQEDSYKNWKKKVKMWRTIATEKDEAKQGAMLILHMKGKAVDLCLDATDSKVSTLFTVLDSIYGAPENLLNEYEEFENLKRESNQTMKEFVHLFERKVTHLTGRGLVIPDIILSSKLLKGASLSANDEKIARATCDTEKSAEVKATLIRLSDGGTKVNSVVKKEEFAYYGSQMDRNTHQRLCYGCANKGHWIRDCPWMKDREQRETFFCNEVPLPLETKQPLSTDNKKQKIIEKQKEKDPKETEKVRVFYSVEEEDNRLDGDVSNAVLDCGAKKTVCGQDWFYRFFENLSPVEKQAVLGQLSDSDTVFWFGAGEPMESKKVLLPVNICDVDIMLETHVVDTDIPMLLSLQLMKSLGMCIDTATDTVRVNSKLFPLELSNSGHYMIPLLSQLPQEQLSARNATPSPTVLNNFILENGQELRTNVNWETSQIDSDDAKAPSQKRAKFNTSDEEEQAWLSPSDPQMISRRIGNDEMGSADFDCKYVM